LFQIDLTRLCFKPGFDNVFDAELQKAKTNLRESKIDAASQNDLVNKVISDKLKNESETKMSPLMNSEIINNKIELQVARLSDARASNLTELNLHNSGLTDLDVEALKCLTQLKKLILSFNKLKFIKEIANLTNLDYLDVSYNQIESITGFKVRKSFNSNLKI
jgi:Leucine-rich repeat (LRR) protein